MLCESKTAADRGRKILNRTQLAARVRYSSENRTEASPIRKEARAHRGIDQCGTQRTKHSSSRATVSDKKSLLADRSPCTALPSCQCARAWSSNPRSPGRRRHANRRYGFGLTTPPNLLMCQAAVDSLDKARGIHARIDSENCHKLLTCNPNQ